jgi:hypothetical protein
MGLLLRCPDDKAKPPRAVHLILTCDGRHGAFEGERLTQTFIENGYIAQRRAAMEAGWTITGVGLVICPRCKGRDGKDDD